MVVAENTIEVAQVSHDLVSFAAVDLFLGVSRNGLYRDFSNTDYVCSSELDDHRTADHHGGRSSSLRSALTLPPDAVVDGLQVSGNVVHDVPNVAVWLGTNSPTAVRNVVTEDNIIVDAGRGSVGNRSAFQP